MDFGDEDAMRWIGAAEACAVNDLQAEPLRFGRQLVDPGVEDRDSPRLALGLRRWLQLQRDGQVHGHDHRLLLEACQAD